MIIAKCLNNNIGSWGNYPELEIDKEYEVTSIDVGRWYSTISLAGFGNKTFNSVCFSFFEDGIEIDIYRDQRFARYKRLV